MQNFKNLCKKILVVLAMVLVPTFTIAQVSGSGVETASFWKRLGTTILLGNNAWSLQVPSLGSSGNPCVKVSSTGVFATTTCGASFASTTWGSIIGTLSNQTDLQTALDAKVPKTTTITAGTGLTGGGDLSANRTISLTAPVTVALGGTGTTTAPALNQLLIGNAGGGYNFIATSSLGIPTVTYPISPTNGGTGTTTAFTAGSVVFASSSGNYSQDNANFFWDSTNHRLGIGTTTPNDQIEITKNFRFPVTTSSTVGVILQGANSFIHTYGAANPAAGDANLFIGRSAGNFTLDTTQALGSLAIGDNALNALTTGQYNTAIGSQALLKNTTGIRNTAIGLALYANTTGGNNVGLGLNALYQNTTGSQNLGIGTGALGQMISGNGNIGIGFNALTWGTVGSTNIGIGALTGGGNGNNNIWIGDHNGGGAIGTSNNTGIGFQGMGWLGAGITGGNNTGIGYKSGGNLTSGANNLLLGYQTSDALTTGSNNIAIGYDIDLPSNTGSNQLTIGNLIFGDNTSTGTTISTGNIGMGIATSLGAKLHIVKTTEQLRLGYDPSNYYSTTVGSTGGVTLDAVGSGSNFSFSDKVGFGSTTPISSVSIKGTAGTNLFTVASSTNAIQYEIDSKGHIYQGGTSPGVSSCGTSPSLISGNDNVGRVQAGSVLATSCQIDFATAWDTPPACDANVEGGITTGVAASSTKTSVVFTGASALTGNVFTYQCVGIR